MTESKRLALADVGDAQHVGDVADLRQLLALPAGFEKRLELDRDIKMIFDRVLATTGHQNDVGDAGCDRFFDAVLNDRLVDQRQHLFRLCFRRG